MLENKTNWNEALKPLIEKYKGRKLPLNYRNHYELVIVIILQAQESFKNIDIVSPVLFKAFPDFKSLMNATPEKLFPILCKVRNFGMKANWMIATAKIIKEESNVLKLFKDGVRLPGLGTNGEIMICQELGLEPEGVIVNKTTVRVVDRLGIASGTDTNKIRKQLMEAIPKDKWKEVGIVFLYLGMETCTPNNPKHEECLMRGVCGFYKEVGSLQKAVSK